MLLLNRGHWIFISLRARAQTHGNGVVATERSRHCDAEGNRKPRHYFFPGQSWKMADEYNGPEYGRFLLLDGAGVLRISRSAAIRIEKKSNIKRIDTWNVWSMHELGKLQNTIQEMKRLNISILSVSVWFDVPTDHSLLSRN